MQPCSSPQRGEAGRGEGVIEFYRACLIAISITSRQTRAIIIFCRLQMLPSPISRNIKHKMQTKTKLPDPPFSSRRALLWRVFSGGAQWSALGQRLLLALVGGYFLSAALAALLALGLGRLMPRGEAAMLMAMCAFIIYLFLLLWAFAERRLGRLWLVLGGGAGAAQLALWALKAPAGG